jgi:hypothetical protein
VVLAWLPPFLLSCPAVKVVAKFDFADEERDGYTDICIKNLREGVAAKLADPAQQQQWAQQVGRGERGSAGCRGPRMHRQTEGFASS